MCTSHRRIEIVCHKAANEYAPENTFAKALSEELSPFSSVILHQDSYFRNWGRYPAEVREKIVTANHPGAVCWGGLIEHIQQLVAHQPMDSTTYSTSAKSSLQIPSDASGKNIHVILEIRDDGLPSLMGYRRVIIEVGK
jgi:hypothetical protein